MSLVHHVTLRACGRLQQTRFFWIHSAPQKFEQGARGQGVVVAMALKPNDTVGADYRCVREI